MSFNYKPSKYVLDKVREFAHKRVKGSSALYSSRGEKNLSKMEEDIIIGTLGEYAVQYYCKTIGLKCTRPDLKIYENRRKSFDADLTSVVRDKEIKLHVKSQSTNSIKRYGLSWLFQKSDSLVKSPDDEDMMVFCSVDPKVWEVTIVGFVHPKLVCELGLWGECSVPYYRHSKLAIYLEDLEPYAIVRSELI